MSTWEDNLPGDFIDLDTWVPQEGLSEVIIIDDHEDEVAAIAPVTRKRPVKLRNQAPKYPWTYINEFEHKNFKDRGPRGSRIAIGVTVEYEWGEQHDRNNFMRVMQILHNVNTGEIRLRGLRFRRNTCLSVFLGAKLNEVHLSAQVYDSGIDERPLIEQGLEEIALDQVVQTRRLVLTNRPLPELSFRMDTKLNAAQTTREEYYRLKKSVEDSAVLCCRRVFIKTFSQSMELKTAERQCQREIRYLNTEEVDSPEGGGLFMKPEEPPPDDHQSPAASPQKRKRAEEPELPYSEGEQRHTFGDVFCGAGGASCGARMAGLKVKYGVDKEQIAINTFKSNFVNAETFTMNVFDFIVNLPEESKPYVDILHMSPPCQFFSPAHTTPGVDDDANAAALLSIGALVSSLRPRIATIEETSGLLNEKHSEWFALVVKDLLDAGYSARWAVIRCLAYGCTQPRPRVWVLISARGVPLPEFPRFTHGPPGPELRNTDLRPFTTLRQAAGRIPDNTTLHDPTNLDRWFDARKPRGKPDEHSRRTMLTNNEGDFYHWSGLRQYTIREMACIQSFPLHYQFTGNRSDMKRQIGNAVPPQVFAKMMASCREVLKRLDGYRTTRPRLDSPDVIPIDVEQEYGDRRVVQSVEEAQEQEMRDPTFPPAVATRAASREMQSRDTSVTIGPEDSTDEIIVISDELEPDTVLFDNTSDDDSEAPVPREFLIASSETPDEELGDRFAENDQEKAIVPSDSLAWRSGLSTRFRKALSAPCGSSGTSSTIGSEDVEPVRDLNAAVLRSFCRLESNTVSGDSSRYVTPGFESRPLTPPAASSKNSKSGNEVIVICEDEEEKEDDVEAGMDPPQSLQASNDPRAVSASPGPGPDPSIRARGMMRVLSLQPEEGVGEGGGEMLRERLSNSAVARDRETVVIVIDDD